MANIQHEAPGLILVGNKSCKNELHGFVNKLLTNIPILGLLSLSLSLSDGHGIMRELCGWEREGEMALMPQSLNMGPSLHRNGTFQTLCHDTQWNPSFKIMARPRKDSDVNGCH